MPSARFNHGFENDVFLSYCHRDDETDPSGRCWVSRHTTRMVKVAKTFVPLVDYPPELLETNQHEFFVQEENGNYREYHLHPDPRYRLEYAAHVDDVAQEMARLLARMESAGSAGTAAKADKGVVFVAETSSDLNAERDRVRRRLEQYGYEVRPKKPFAGMIAPEIRQAVERELAAARLAILPVGARYGTIPELGEGASVVWIQLEVAARDRRNGTFPRLVWMPKGVEPAEAQHAALLKEIRETWARKPFEVLELSSHQFEEVLEERLNPRSKPARTPEPASADYAAQPSVYVLAERADVEAAFAIRQWLFENDFEAPGPPENWTDPAALREELRTRFAEDHAFLIYYGQTNEGWVRAQLKEISRAAGLNRKEPILARALFLADPETRAKKQLLLLEMELTGFAPTPLHDALAPFAAEIRAQMIRKGQVLGITRQNLHGQAWVFGALLQVA
jgi:hypothetical protein